VNKDAFKVAILTDEGAEKLKLSLGREFARIRNGDTSPSVTANHNNNPATSREAGLRADLEGVGPLGVKNPIAATAYIEDNLRDELHRLVFFKGTNLDDLDANRLSDREAESKWLVDQILRDSQCKIQMDPAKVDSQPCSLASAAR
jgi:hypothetical protein